MVCRLQRKLQTTAMTLVKCQGQICLKSVFQIFTCILLSDGQCLYMYLAQFFGLIPQTPQSVLITMKVSDHQYDLGVKGQGYINLSTAIIANSSSIFVRGCSYFAQWLHMVCR